MRFRGSGRRWDNGGFRGIPRSRAEQTHLHRSFPASRSYPSCAIRYDTKTVFVGDLALQISRQELAPRKVTLAVRVLLPWNLGDEGEGSRPPRRARGEKTVATVVGVSQSKQRQRRKKEEGKRVLLVSKSPTWRRRKCCWRNSAGSLRCAGVVVAKVVVPLSS